MQRITRNPRNSASQFYLPSHFIALTAKYSIIRILFMIPIYSVVAWLSIHSYRKSVYFEVLGDCYEAFTISAFFSLLCYYIAPDLHTQKEYFRGVKPKPWIWLHHLGRCWGEKRYWRTPRSGLTWFNVGGHSLMRKLRELMFS